MPDWITLHIIGLIVVAALFGGMLFFMAVFAPLTFRKLPEETARGFIRAVFPVYYRICGVTALVAALPLVTAAYRGEVAALVLVAAGFVFANAVLRPAIERASENGDEGRVRRFHLASVLLHLVQFAAVAVILVRLAQ